MSVPFRRVLGLGGIGRVFKEAEGQEFDGDDPALAGLLKAALLGKPLDSEGLRSERDKRTALRLVPRPNGRN